VKRLLHTKLKHTQKHRKLKLYVVLQFPPLRQKHRRVKHIGQRTSITQNLTN
jgi:hypothetical protein